MGDQLFDPRRVAAAAAVIIAMLAGRIDLNMVAQPETMNETSKKQTSTLGFNVRTITHLGLARAHEQRLILSGVILQLFRQLDAARRYFELAGITFRFQTRLRRLTAALDKNLLSFVR